MKDKRRKDRDILKDGYCILAERGANGITVYDCERDSEYPLSVKDRKGLTATLFNAIFSEDVNCALIACPDSVAVCVGGDGVLLGYDVLTLNKRGKKEIDEILKSLSIYSLAFIKGVGAVIVADSREEAVEKLYAITNECEECIRATTGVDFSDSAGIIEIFNGKLARDN